MTAINIPVPTRLEQFEADLEKLRLETLEKIGEEDADHIRRIIRLQRAFEVGGRSMLMFSVLPPFWLMGTAMLSISKILDNMEIGHNVMHGQYDWMNDTDIHSSSFEWDTACDGQSWRRTHNFEHHTFTNIRDKDRDYGYGILRMDNEEPWKPTHLFNLVRFGLLSALFQWGVAAHELEIDRIRKGEVTWKDKIPFLKDFAKKGGRQFFKDYLFFPTLGLTTGSTLPIITGNMTANLVRNLWASAVIFCGHFPEGAHVFNENDCEVETKGEWYYRQILGSCNFKGGNLMHIMSGHLNFQIEHHLFPDIPSSRYAELSSEVQAICQRYDIPYNTRSFTSQYFSAVKRIAKLSLPD